MRVGCLGAGAWGFCLALLLAKKGHEVIVWTINEDLAKQLTEKKEHPSLPGHVALPTMQFTTDLKQAISRIDLLVESVTSAGIRPVFNKVLEVGVPNCPIVITSKGIEQNSGLLLSEVIIEVLGEQHLHQIGCLSGPSLADEVIKNQPTSVVCSAYTAHNIHVICEAFSTPFFRVYPNGDVPGASFGGAMKNIIAIACGISDGLGYGDNSKAALMTRGLHEIRKLSVTKNCNPETLNGLAGLGDICTTCLSTKSRNYRFGKLIAEGLSIVEAQAKINMAIEGYYTCLSAIQLAQKAHISVPIIESVYQVLYQDMPPMEAAWELMRRKVQEEHL